MSVTLLSSCTVVPPAPVFTVTLRKLNPALLMVAAALLNRKVPVVVKVARLVRLTAPAVTVTWLAPQFNVPPPAAAETPPVPAAPLIIRASARVTFPLSEAVPTLSPAIVLPALVKVVGPSTKSTSVEPGV